MYCSKCGKKISDESRFCQFCGTPIVIEEEDSEEVKTEQPKAEPVVSKNDNGNSAKSAKKKTVKAETEKAADAGSDSKSKNFAEKVKTFDFKGIGEKLKNIDGKEIIAKVKSADKALLIAVIAALLIIIVLPGIIKNAKYNAQLNSSLNDHNFIEADNIATIQNKKDARLNEYIDAGVAYEKGEYEKAITGFNDLGDYKDSKEMFKTSVSAMLERYLRYEDYPNAVNLLVTYSTDSTAIEELFNEYKAEIYKQTVKEYNSGDYSETMKVFDALSGYEDADRYATLCRIHLSSPAQSEQYYDFLINNVDFADAKNLLVSNFNIAIKFFGGLWYTLDRSQTFEIALDNYGTYRIKTTLPWRWEKPGQFDIEDGILFVTDPDTLERTNMVRFNVIDENNMSVYDYKIEGSYDMIRSTKR